MKKEYAILFDLDGTLWDALSPITLAWNEEMKARNLPIVFSEARIKSFMGLTPEETYPLAFPGYSFADQAMLFKACIASEITYLSKHPGRLYPQEKETLSLLTKTYSLYIVSNSDKGYVENYLEACHVASFFAGHVCAGDTGLPKWGNILYMMKRENLTRVLYIGDTLKDKDETEKAGIPFIHAAYGFGVIPDCPHAITHFSDLPKEASRIFKIEI
ncbi:MAG: HAD family hydrolase [Bacilli bacterium]